MKKVLRARRFMKAALLGASVLSLAVARDAFSQSSPQSVAAVAGASSSYDETAAGGWSRLYRGGRTRKEEALADVLPTGDGGYLVLGETVSFGAGARDVLVLRLDPAGRVLWQKTYGGARGEIVWAKSLSGVFSEFAPEDLGFARAHGGGYLLAKLPKKSFFRVFAGKRLLLLKVGEGGEVAWTKAIRSPDVDDVVSFSRPKLLIRPTSAGGYLFARDVLEWSKSWPGQKEPADKGGGFLLRRWDEARAGECVVAADDAKRSLPGMKVERVKVKFVAAPTATAARPTEGLTRETSVAPAPAPACVVEEKKKQKK